MVWILTSFFIVYSLLLAHTFNSVVNLKFYYLNIKKSTTESQYGKKQKKIILFLKYMLSYSLSQNHLVAPKKKKFALNMPLTKYAGFVMG